LSPFRAQKLNITLKRTNLGATIEVGRSQAAPFVASSKFCWNADAQMSEGPQPAR
jgi:hypothetical protein